MAAYNQYTDTRRGTEISPGEVRMPGGYNILTPGKSVPRARPDNGMETVRMPQAGGGAVVVTRPRQQAANPAASAPAAAALGGPAPDISYRSGINVGGGIGGRGVLAGLLSTGKQPSPDVSAFTRATAMNDYSQLGRGIAAQNQEMQMTQQAKRSEATTEGASNLAKISGDYAERQNSQIGLAAQIAANNIGFAAGLQGAFDPWAGFRAGQSAWSGQQ